MQMCSIQEESVDHCTVSNVDYEGNYMSDDEYVDEQEIKCEENVMVDADQQYMQGVTSDTCSAHTKEKTNHLDDVIKIREIRNITENVSSQAMVTNFIEPDSSQIIERSEIGLPTLNVEDDSLKWKDRSENYSDISLDSERDKSEGVIEIDNSDDESDVINLSGSSIFSLENLNRNSVEQSFFLLPDADYVEHDVSNSKHHTDENRDEGNNDEKKNQ